MSEYWDELSKEQQEAVNVWRKRVGDLLNAEKDAFYREYPELRLTWNFTSEALIRSKHPAILEEL